MRNSFAKSNVLPRVACTLAALTLAASMVFAAAPHATFLSPVLALSIYFPMILIALVTSVLFLAVVAMSCKIISQNKELGKISQQIQGVQGKEGAHGRRGAEGFPGNGGKGPSASEVAAEQVLQQEIANELRKDPGNANDPKDAKGDVGIQCIKGDTSLQGQVGKDGRGGEDADTEEVAQKIVNNPDHLQKLADTVVKNTDLQTNIKNKLSNNLKQKPKKAKTAGVVKSRSRLGKLEAKSHKGSKKKHYLQNQLGKIKNTITQGKSQIDEMREKIKNIEAQGSSQSKNTAKPLTSEEFKKYICKKDCADAKCKIESEFRNKAQTLDELVYPPQTKENLQRLLDIDSFMKTQGHTLLHGPPGTGKTMIARIIAKEAKGKVAFVKIPPADLFDKSNIDLVFQEAKENAPCIIFLDEFDSIARSRTLEGARWVHLNHLLDKITSLSNNVKIIATTNHKDSIDSALISNTDRFGNVIEVPDLSGKENRAIRISVISNCLYNIASSQGVQNNLQINDEQCEKKRLGMAKNKILLPQQIGELASMTENFTAAMIKKFMDNVKTKILSKNQKDKITVLDECAEYAKDHNIPIPKRCQKNVDSISQSSEIPRGASMELEQSSTLPSLFNTSYNASFISFTGGGIPEYHERVPTPCNLYNHTSTPRKNLDLDREGDENNSPNGNQRLHESHIQIVVTPPLHNTMNSLSPK